MSASSDGWPCTVVPGGPAPVGLAVSPLHTCSLCLLFLCLEQGRRVCVRRARHGWAWKGLCVTVPLEPRGPGPGSSAKEVSVEMVCLMPPAVTWWVPGRRLEGWDVCVGLAPTGAQPLWLPDDLRMRGAAASSHSCAQGLTPVFCPSRVLAGRRPLQTVGDLRPR